MDVSDKDVVVGMLRSLTPGQFLLLLDAVSIKESGKYYHGCLVLLRHELEKAKKYPTKTDSSVDNSHPTLAILFSDNLGQCKDVYFSKKSKNDGYFLLWVPYSFIIAYLSDTSLASLCCIDYSHFILPFSVDRKSGITEEPLEWSCMFFVSVKSVAKVRRHFVKGKAPIIVLYFVDDTIGPPLIFERGGLFKFFEELKKISPLRQSSVFPDDFFVYCDINNETKDNVLAFSEYKTDKENGCVGDGCGTSMLRGLRHDRSILGKGHARVVLPSDELLSVVYKRDKFKNDRNVFAAAATKLHRVFSWFHQRHESTDSNVISEPLSSGHIAIKGEVNEKLCESAGEDALFRFRIPLFLPLERGHKMGPSLTVDEWNKCFSVVDGRIDTLLFENAKKKAYEGGVEKGIRLRVWCFMLNLYPNVANSTESERNAVHRKYREKYKQLTKQWNDVLLMDEKGYTVEENEKEKRKLDSFSFCFQVRSAIQKDVFRTDRAHEKYRSDNSLKLCMLENVLMSYAVFKPDLGYCQGMSDILSPIALLSENEEDVFMCFSCFIAERCEGLFQQDVVEGIRPRLEALQTIVRHFIPELYSFLRTRDCDDMSFCFRWLLLLFKREFSLDDTMLLWDVILCCPYTPQFEIFIAAALLKLFAPQIVSNNLSQDALITSINKLPEKLNVCNVILLARELYDYVATCVLEMKWGKMPSEITERPTLDDILKAVEC